MLFSRDKSILKRWKRNRIIYYIERASLLAGLDTGVFAILKPDLTFADFIQCDHLTKPLSMVRNFPSLTFLQGDVVSKEDYSLLFNFD